MVQLYLNGKSRSEIVKEYDLTASSLDKWIKQHQASGSFKEKDNRNDEENELIRLRKENLDCISSTNRSHNERVGSGVKSGLAPNHEDNLLGRVL
jgi:transposase-like protein